MTSTRLSKNLQRFIHKFESQSLLSNEQKAELDRRLEEYKQGKGKNYTWEEVKMKLRKDSKENK